MTQRVLVIDDHPLYRRALADLVRTMYGQDNVLESASVEAGIAAAPEAVRLVLLDFRIPRRKEGAEAVALVRQRLPAAAVIVVTASEERREAAAALQAGAAAVLSKATPMHEMETAIRGLLEGGEPPSGWRRGAAETGPDGAASLSPRQLEILAMLCEGLSNKEISLRLGVALVTVKTHVAAIFRALGVVSRTQAVLAARRLGL